VIWSAGYLLWLYQRTFYGEITQPINTQLPDADARERASLFPMVIMALVMGVASPLWIRMIDPSVQHSLRPTSVNAAAAAPGAKAAHVAMGERVK
jgi:NADH-quinone oxidoreductase subunit M